MIATESHSNLPNSAISSASSPKLVRISYRCSSEMKVTERNEFLIGRQPAEEPTGVADRSRNLKRASASAAIVKQNRSSSAGGKRPPYRLEESRSRKIHQEMIEINPSPRQEDLVKIHPTVLTVRNSGANARIPTSAVSTNFKYFLATLICHINVVYSL
ncbi:unnamed protein product [Rodentolepis nana]|uniref:Uncharacterized protein n=1 Tax=Rodentolepis nana TaxID=102285 RepID=A0A0R3TUB3_RODNA|nr:unnamed protein product [Rodentolepis nana]